MDGQNEQQDLRPYAAGTSVLPYLIRSITAPPSTSPLLGYIYSHTYVSVV